MVYKMDIIMMYIVAGMIWVMFIEYMSTKQMNDHPMMYGEQDEWSMVERIWNIIIWPITFLMMAHQFLGYFFNNNDKDED